MEWVAIGVGILAAIAGWFAHSWFNPPMVFEFTPEDDTAEDVTEDIDLIV